MKKKKASLRALQHTLHKLSQGAPVVLTRCQLMLIHKQHIMLEARIQMWLKSQLQDDWVVVAVDMSVDTVETLEHLSEESWEGFGERHSC